MTLYFVAATTDDHQNMDLFVHANTPTEAANHWRLYYIGWDWPDALIVYDPSGVALADQILTWQTIPRTEITL